MLQSLASVGASRRFRTYGLAGCLFLIVSITVVSFSNVVGEDGSLSNLVSDYRPGGKHGPYSKSSGGLSVEDFNREQHFATDEQRHLYETVDTWRSPDSFAPTYPHNGPARPIQPGFEKYASKADYLKQPLNADYAEGADKMFLMIKTGADVLWKRLPVHLFTTLTRVPHFALYSDSADSIGGYEVIDILANVTQETLLSNDFVKYRHTRQLHDDRTMRRPTEVKEGSGWDLDKYKNIPMILDAYRKKPDADWYTFMDGDSYVMIDTMLAWLNTLDPEKPLYLGSTAMFGALPFGHGGSVVTLSRKMVELTVGQHPEYVQEYERRVAAICCGDVIVASMIKEKLGLEISRGTEWPNNGYRYQGDAQWDLSIEEDHWCHNIHSFHHLASSEIETLWEYERLRGPTRNNITWGDMYRDFYMPYIADRVDNWDNRAAMYGGDSFTPEKTGLKAPYPYTSFDDCRKACEEADWCLSFRFKPDYCGISGNMKLGQADLPFVTDDEDFVPFTSGFMIDRVRDFRRRTPCDDLFGKADEFEGPRDGSADDKSEGWFLRRRAVEAGTRHSSHVGESPDEAESYEDESDEDESYDEAELNAGAETDEDFSVENFDPNNER